MSKSTIYQVPEQITIPGPMPVIRQRGRHATGDLYGRNIKVRVSIDERQLLERVAAKCDMSIASLVRWCCVRAAEEIEKDYNQE